MRTARLLPVSPSMHFGGGFAPRGVSAPGGLLLGGACLWSGGGIPACNEADPHMNRMTDRCKNITLPQTSFAGGNKLLVDRKKFPQNYFVVKNMSRTSSWN